MKRILGSFAPLHAHTCCLRNRIQSLTRASRQANCLRFRSVSCISYGLLRASHSRNPTGMSVFAVFHTASRSYLLPSKSHTVSYARFATGELFAFSKRVVYKLRIAPCFALSQSYRHERFRRVSHGFTLIPVAFEIAYSLLRALRVRRACLRFRRAYTRIYITDV